jgi:sugar fermentation stimulation protein A
LQELTRLAEEGYGAYVLFVIQMDRVKYLHPNDATDPAFGNALRQAAAAGVQVMAVDCHVTPDSMRIAKAVAVHLSV